MPNRISATIKPTVSPRTNQYLHYCTLYNPAALFRTAGSRYYTLWTPAGFTAEAEYHVSTCLRNSRVNTQHGPNNMRSYRPTYSKQQPKLIVFYISDSKRNMKDMYVLIWNN